MRTWLAKWQPSPWLMRKMLMIGVLVGVGVASFCWGRRQNAEANPPQDGVAATPNARLADYNRRVVAYLYNNEPVSREELGEYLIARFGSDRLDFMINRKIVESEAKKYNITVSDGEVESRFQRDLSSFGTTRLSTEEFVNNILKRFGKTLYEWKEDVIRPKLMMEKLVRPKLTITDKDVREGFEARYGPKIECRMIVLDHRQPKIMQSIWEKARKGRQEFLAEAKTQFIPNLAQLEGKVPPIHMHFGDANLEDAAFRLKEGEISGLIQLKDGTVVMLLCEQRLPADSKVRYQDVSAKLSLEMEELRLAQRIPEEFAEMRRRANPQLLLTPTAQQFASAPPPPTVVPVSGTTPNPAPVQLKPAADLPPVPVPQPVTPKIELPAAPLPSLTPPPAPTTGTPPAPTAPAPMGVTAPPAPTTGTPPAPTAPAPMGVTAPPAPTPPAPTGIPLPPLPK